MTRRPGHRSASRTRCPATTSRSERRSPCPCCSDSEIRTRPEPSAIAHDEAVRSALDFAERHAVWSRRGHAGKNQIRCDGLIAAAFRHRTSRNGDPHLHSHVLVPNMVRGVDGKWATIDGRWIYTSAKTIGYLYEAQLRHNLTVALGVEWGEVKNGIADIVGIPENVLEAFSTRRAEIEERWRSAASTLRERR